MTLSSGRHGIALAATDKDGNTATVSIDVFAGGRIYLPVSTRSQ